MKNQIRYVFGCVTDILQPLSQKSHTPTVPKEFNIGLHDPAEADLEHFWNCCSAGFLGERLYRRGFSKGLVATRKTVDGEKFFRANALAVTVDRTRKGR